MPARVCTPTGVTWGSVVIATDIYGVNRFYKGIAESLAAEGCAAIVPDIFFREGPLLEVSREAAFKRRRLLDDARALRDLAKSLDWLVEKTDAPGATLGFCLGGNLVFHLASQHNDRPTVAYYSFPGGLPAPKGLAPPLEIVGDLAGPILAFWGDADENVGMDNVGVFEAAIGSVDVDYEQHIYPGVGHGFLAGLADPADLAHQAAKDSWNRTLAFLRQHARRDGSSR